MTAFSDMTTVELEVRMLEVFARKPRMGDTSMIIVGTNLAQALRAAGTDEDDMMRYALYLHELSQHGHTLADLADYLVEGMERW